MEKLSLEKKKKIRGHAEDLWSKQNDNETLTLITGDCLRYMADFPMKFCIYLLSLLIFCVTIISSLTVKYFLIIK